MKANTAICFFLIGIALWSLQTKRIDKQPFRVLGKLCASVVTLVGALTLYEYFSGNSLGIDRLLFQEPAGAVFTTYPGRMALITAVNFFIAGIALLSLDKKTKRGDYPSQFLAAAAGCITLIALCGYIYGVSSFSGRVSIYTAMALHTTIAFILLCIGLLFARPDKGLSGVITSSFLGGAMMRRMISAAIIIPMLTEWLRFRGEKAGLYNCDFGTALSATANVILLVGITWLIAAFINHSEKEHKITKTRLDTADEEWKITFDSMSDPAFIIDMDNTIRNVNSAFAKILAKSPEEIIGKKCYEIMHGLSAPLSNCPMEGTRRDGKPHIEEVNDPHIGIPLLVTTSPVFDKDHRMIGVVHVAKDISAIKKTEAALRESEIKYRTIFESSADAIMLTIPEKGFTAGNEAAVRMFGCKDEKEFIAQSPASLSPPGQPDGQSSSAKAQKMMRIAMERGINFFEWTHRRMNGEEFFATVLLTRMELGGKKILQATVHDITERISSEKRLAKKLRDFEIFYKAAIDREMKIKELKKKVQELEAKMRG
jgi:PAS domain S-box-containing protein